METQRGREGTEEERKRERERLGGGLRQRLINPSTLIRPYRTERHLQNG